MASIIASPAWGLVTSTNNNFNDLIGVASWPVQQNIEKITRVQIWAQSDLSRVIGITITYQVKDSGAIDIRHGETFDATLAGDFEVGSNETLAGISGVVNSDSYLSRIGFLRVNNETGEFNPTGLVPATTGSGKAFSSLGEIVAFGGTESRIGNLLDTLSVYKYVPGEVDAN